MSPVQYLTNVFILFISPSSFEVSISLEARGHKRSSSEAFGGQEESDSDDDSHDEVRLYESGFKVNFSMLSLNGKSQRNYSRPISGPNSFYPSQNVAYRDFMR